MIYDSIAALVGQTPLLRLERFARKSGAEAEIVAKIEYFNPAGSVKDRVALNMIEQYEKEGRLNEKSVIIEPTSGNTGIGLAAICAAKGYKAIIVMPDTMSKERRMLMTAYGAELVLTDGALGMQGAIAKAEELAKEIPNSFIPGQFDNPSNPTGMGYERETMEVIASTAIEHDLLVAVDEIYTSYIYEGEFVPLRTLPGMAERTITLNSFSKNFLMTGWRVGTAIAEPYMIKTMQRINASIIYSAPSISQRAAIQALNMRNEIRETYVTRYRERIFYACERIEQIPYLELCRPKGTFYLFPSCKKTGMNSVEFCNRLLEEAHVLVSPGSIFGRSAEGHFRIACTVDIPQLKEAFDRMEKLSF